jgi:hypothetical protein
VSSFRRSERLSQIKKSHRETLYRREHVQKELDTNAVSQHDGRMKTASPSALLPRQHSVAVARIVFLWASSAGAKQNAAEFDSACAYKGDGSSYQRNYDVNSSVWEIHPVMKLEELPR